MNITEAMIAAGARAMWCAARGLPESAWTNSPSHILDDFTRDYWRDKARACLTAAIDQIVAIQAQAMTLRQGAGAAKDGAAALATIAGLPQ